MRLTLVISSLRCGGAERVFSLLANYWAEHRQDVTLLTRASGEAPFYRLHPAVIHRALGYAPEYRNALVGLFRNLRRIWVLRRAIRDSRSDVVISFVDQTNVLTLIATRGLGIPVIVSERVNPAFYDIGTVWNRLRRLAYPLTDALVCQTPAVRSQFRWIRGKVEVIPNPAVLPATIKKDDGSVPSGGDKRLIVAMGRLGKQKGFDLLLRAYQAVSSHHPDWSLTILGEGPLRRELEEQIERLGLAGRVELLGRVSDPFAVLRKASLFVLSSRFEGFPNSLLEAMACGLPVVSFDCPSGPREIIRDEVDGVLVPREDVNALAAALDRLMANPAERERLAKRAPEVLERFGMEEIMGMWNKLIAQVRK